MTALLATLSFAQAQNHTTPRKTTPSASSTQPAGADLPAAATVDAFMKHTFGYSPELRWNVVSIKPFSDAPSVAEVVVSVGTEQGSQMMRLFVLPGGKWALSGDLIPFGADPFGPVREKLEARANGPSKGPADSSITVVEFTDLQCPACKATQPVIDRLLQDLPNVHFIYQNFPLAMHSWSFKAASYADCVGRENNAALWKYIHTVFENQEQITPENADGKLKQYAAEAGAAGDVASCAAQPATEERVRLSQALGLSVGVDSTPTLFINGRKVANALTVPYDTLKALVSGTPKQ